MQDFNLEVQQQLAARLLTLSVEQPSALPWSVQGFGMFRLYLDPKQEYRLHVWYDDARVEDVSDIHDHPWDFTSIILWGTLVNTRYLEGAGELWNKVTIQCGEGACIKTPPEQVLLQPKVQEVLSDGMTYQQRAEEFHRTTFGNGTVTLIKRTFGEDRDHARIFYPVDKEWIDAEPRPATPDEILVMAATALKRFRL